MKALFTGFAYSFTKKEVIEYAILPDDGSQPTDVALLARPPNDCTVYYPDLERGISKVFDWETRKCLVVLEGDLMQVLGTAIFRLYNTRVVDRIPAQSFVESATYKAEELRKKAESGEPLTDTTFVVKGERGEYGGDVIVMKPPEDEQGLAEIIKLLAKKVTASRRRTLLVAPVFLKVNDEWVVVPLSRALHILREDPTSIKAAGIFDPDGFSTVFFIADEVPPDALGNTRQHYANVEYLNNMIREAAITAIMPTGYGGMMSGAEFRM